MSKMRVVIFAAILAFTYAQAPRPQTCEETFKTCKTDALNNGPDLNKLWSCGSDYAKCRVLNPLDCIKECHTTVQACRHAAPGFLDKAQCWVDFATCGKNCNPLGGLGDEMLAENDLEDDNADPTCKDQYKTCRRETVLKGDFFGIWPCAKSYIKCRAAPAYECAIVCKDTLLECRNNAGSNVIAHAQCVIDSGKCAKQCKLAPADEIPGFMLDDSELTLDDGTDEASCGEKYKTCRAGAVSNVDIKAMYQCGKDYVKCRGGPAVSCVKQCTRTFLDCRKVTPGFLDKAQCYVDGGKCAVQCKLAPHFDEISSDDMEDDIADQTCKDQYKTCRKEKILKGDIFGIWSCATTYLKCRATPFVECAKVCKETLSGCLTAAGSDIIAHGQCLIDSGKCAKECKLAPSDELPENILDDSDGCAKKCTQVFLDCQKLHPEVFDKAQCYIKAGKCDTQCRSAQYFELPETMLEDGTDEASCGEKYKTCRAGAVSNADIKVMYQCGKDYVKCRGGPAVNCVKQCIKTFVDCRKMYPSFLDRAQCYIDGGKCTVQCRAAPHFDEIQSDDEENVEDVMDDGTTEKGTSQDVDVKNQCKDEYNKCRNDAVTNKDIKGMFLCGAKLAKCKASPIAECLKQCYLTLKDCRRIFPGLMGNAQCLADVAKCVYTCGKTGGQFDEEIADQIQDEDDKSCADVYNECRTSGSSIKQCATSYLKCRGGPLVSCLKTCHANMLDCRGKASGFFNRTQCYLDLVKCTTQCKVAPHNDEVMDVQLDQNDDDQSCSNVYNQCRTNAEQTGTIKSIYECGKQYLICRGTPAVTCAVTCAFTLKECRANADGILGRAKCWPQFGKCMVLCRPGPHSDSEQL